MIDISSQKSVGGQHVPGPITALYDPAQLELKAMPALKTAFNHWYASAHIGFAPSPWKNASSCSKSTRPRCPKCSVTSSPKFSPISPKSVQNCPRQSIEPSSRGEPS